MNIKFENYNISREKWTWEIVVVLRRNRAVAVLVLGNISSVLSFLLYLLKSLEVLQILSVLQSAGHGSW